MAVVFSALREEYRTMAPWYDWFWGSYLDITFEKPLDLVQCSIKGRASNKDNDGVAESTTVIVTVADVGCGTGEFLTRLEQQQQQQFVPNDDGRTTNNKVQSAIELSTNMILYGVEPSHEMLEQAKKKKYQTTRWIEAPAEELPLDNSSVDIVVSTNAFHFFRDQKGALSEMYRVLKEDRIDQDSADAAAHTFSCPSLVITDWCADYWLVRLYHFRERLWWNYWKGYQEKYPGPLRSKNMELLVKEAGFSNVSIDTYQVRVFFLFYWGMQTITATKKKDTV
jgi:ubiquinone/menaquinone biosynthesis C-methylase UbiE